MANTLHAVQVCFESGQASSGDRRVPNPDVRTRTRREVYRGVQIRAMSLEDSGQGRLPETVNTTQAAVRKALRAVLDGVDQPPASSSPRPSTRSSGGADG